MEKCSEREDRLACHEVEKKGNEQGLEKGVGDGKGKGHL
jgi:hypothetical protein